MWNENRHYGLMGGGILTYSQNRMKEWSFFYLFHVITENWYFWPKSLKQPVSCKLWSTQWALLMGTYTYSYAETAFQPSYIDIIYVEVWTVTSRRERYTKFFSLLQQKVDKIQSVLWTAKSKIQACSIRPRWCAILIVWDLIWSEFTLPVHSAHRSPTQLLMWVTGILYTNQVCVPMSNRFVPGTRSLAILGSTNWYPDKRSSLVPRFPNKSSD